MDTSSAPDAARKQALMGFVLPRQYAERFDHTQVHPTFSQDLIRELAAASIDFDTEGFQKVATALMRESADAEQFLVQAITGAAMVLGEWWSYDRISYSAVKLGTQRLEELVFEIADERLRMHQKPDNPHKVIITYPSQSSHTLGSFVAAEIFNWHGWSVTSGPHVKFENVPEILAHESFDLLGVTLAVEHDLLLIHQLISRCRSVSKNKNLLVVVGGTQAFLRPNLAEEVNADFVATNASQAQAQAMSLLVKAA